MPPAASDKKVLRLNMTLPPWIDFAIDSEATWISRGADGGCHITGGAALLPSGEDGS
jgi:hypothetical protein